MNLTRMALVAAVLVAAAVGARADFDITSYTIDGGGGVSAGDGFELSGTIGQPDANGTLSGGSFALTGGFWATVGSVIDCGSMPGDLDGSGVVDLADYATFATCFGESPVLNDACICSDLDHNGSVGIDDYDLFSVHLDE
jgi:hypothetical protein